MKNTHFNILLLLFIAAISLTGCKGKTTSTRKEVVPEKTQQPVAAPIIGSETRLLLKELNDAGDYVNSQEFPSLIKASIVNESLGKNILVIDIRPSAQYAQGHINGAVNKKFEDLPAYFETGIKPFQFDKIIIVSDDGQVSSYTTCLLRLMGYGNVYSMRWGMSAWNKQYAESGWLKGISGKYEDKLEKTDNGKPVAERMPDLNTGLSTGPEIADARFKKLFEEGSDDVLISADEVFADPSKYFIINLERKDKYEDGHIPGAVRYKPESTLGFTDEMATIPADKNIVVYCSTGHNSGFATAYLRLFGYKARTLKYGNNGFMHEKMVKERTTLSWLPFSLEDVNDFPVMK
jgi:rhodanese-related sulfurtransferase